ncbi:U3 small nucleolar RNA-associated protein 14 homolog A [Eublepharis macularius]|uniref:U3 small nucleolar RNA-associated protein 14 homolog A n=1 Tax=Eublepharis macularius TaxID=481883 RepID=A0AA97KBZ3_EUBMA|nr:U3 small nucleolar RNA-associated protein 14 homolog A [Eublepharis macularius]
MAAEKEAVKNEPALSDPEEEEEEDDEVAAKKHQQLVETLSTLAGGKRPRAAERTEASRYISEYDVGGGGANEKVLLSELLKPVSTSSALGSIRKQLSKVRQTKAVQLPLSKEENERVVREAAYTQTSQALAKWDPIVRQNRNAEQLVFPLQQDCVTVAPIEEVISNWKPRTPLEEEIFNLLHKTQQPVKDPLLTPHEKASLKAMSLEEAQLRRMELQRARALQSYYEAKARRERKIKSKKFHKLLRKGKSSKVLQEFEMLRKCNPEAALEQLEKMERARIEERMSLKHQNKGRWAKSTVIMAKYDLEARQAMQEQLARNKELTQKAQPTSDSEEDGKDLEADGGLVPDVINEGHVGVDPDNPWMLGKASAESKEEPRVPEDSVGDGMEEEEPTMSNEEALLQDFAERRQGLRCLQVTSEAQGLDGEEAALMLPDVLPPAPPSPGPEEPLLREKLERLRTLEDMEALEPEEVVQREQSVQSEGAEPLQPVQAELLSQADGGRTAAAKKTGKRQSLIDLKAVLADTSTSMQCPLVPRVVQDELESTTDQRQVIREAFASDNVVADFVKEKRRAEQDGKPKAVDLVLPGWGEWGGTGLQPSTKKRRRFLIKPAPGPPRKDQHLPHVIISEQRNISAAAHQVNQLPFPFESSQQFERSIQAPVGSTWNTQRAFQRLTAPQVITLPGHIIQPISAEDANLIRQTDQEKAAGQKPALDLISLSKCHDRRRASKKKSWKR